MNRYLAPKAEGHTLIRVPRPPVSRRWYICLRLLLQPHSRPKGRTEVLKKKGIAAASLSKSLSREGNYWYRSWAPAQPQTHRRRDTRSSSGTGSHTLLPNLDFRRLRAQLHPREAPLLLIQCFKLRAAFVRPIRQRSLQLPISARKRGGCDW